MTSTAFRLAALAGALAAAAPAHAQGARTWNLGSFPAPSPTPTAGCTFVGGATATGNRAECRATGSTATSLVVRGYRLNGRTSASTVGTAAVRTHGTAGLGVCHSLESCTAPNHAVDNIDGAVDFLLLDFLLPTRLETIDLGWTGTDADVQVLRWTGSGDPTSTLVGATAGAMTGANSWSVFRNLSNLGLSPVGLGNTNTFSRFWIVAAYNPAFQDMDWTANNDAIKLASVAGTVVPEPSTYALVGTGLAGLALLRRRRRQG